MEFLANFIMGAATFICFYLVCAFFKWLFGNRDEDEDEEEKNLLIVP